MNPEQAFLKQAISLAENNVNKGGRPFGAVLVKEGKIIAEGINQMLEMSDPTSHAELNALRAAGKKLNVTRLEGCEVYASGQPCPMCLAAMRMAGISKIVFSLSNEQAVPFGLSTAVAAKDLNSDINTQTWAEIRHNNIDPDATLYKKWQLKNHTK